MVDPTKGSGPVQNIATAANKPREAAGRAKEAQTSAHSSSPQDEVSISREALDLAAAEKAAADVKTSLQNNPALTLGLDPGFLNETV